MNMQLLLLLLIVCTALVASFTRPQTRMRTRGAELFAGPRPLHDEFTVEMASPELLEDLKVKQWGIWGTEGSAKYKKGIKSPLKVYDCNELSYIISGSMTITPAVEGGEPVVVEKGDFVTFPEGFACYWFVKEPIVKNYYIY